MKWKPAFPNEKHMPTSAPTPTSVKSQHGLAIYHPPLDKPDETQDEKDVRHLLSGKANTPQKLFEIYNHRIQEETGIINPLKTLKEFDDERLMADLTELNDHSLLRDMIEASDVEQLISVKIKRLGVIYARNKELADEWLKERATLKDPRGNYTPLLGIERKLDNHVKEAFHLIRWLAPLPLRGFELKLVSRSGLVMPYNSQVAIRLIRCKSVYYTKTPELYGLLHFNDFKQEYAFSAYATMFHEPKWPKFPDDKEWGTDHPEFTAASSYNSHDHFTYYD